MLGYAIGRIGCQVSGDSDAPLHYMKSGHYCVFPRKRAILAMAMLATMLLTKGVGINFGMPIAPASCRDRGFKAEERYIQYHHNGFLRKWPTCSMWPEILT